jgi:hypothetical protein
MVRCAVSHCKNYFHKKCVEDASKDLPEGIKELIKSFAIIKRNQYANI